MWGKPEHSLDFSHQLRSTPTRVGKTSHIPTNQSHLVVHPHACGENHVRRRLGDRLLGSTPTRVGKTIPGFCGHSCITVHPHACGENKSASLRSFPEKGPPPRVWGKLFAAGLISQDDRSTPTRVGKTSLNFDDLAASEVHPHACGENMLVPVKSTGSAGPPPRVWGKPRLEAHFQLRQQVHPHACGENAESNLRVARMEVHPHACGENVWLCDAFVGSKGPPPRVWGKLFSYTSKWRKHRSTPTRVGKTILRSN